MFHIFSIKFDLRRSSIHRLTLHRGFIPRRLGVDILQQILKLEEIRLDSRYEVAYGHLDVHDIFFHFPSNSPLLRSEC